MSKGAKNLVFAVGFFMALSFYINIGVYDIIKESLPTTIYLTETAGVSIDDNVFIALGFALVYCLVGGVFAMMGAHLYIYVCNVLGITNKLYKTLNPPCPPWESQEKKEDA